ncbi:MAG: aminodeoxychorismate/anthranilate synthase component [Clostridia bacterium]|jgi:anthranilate synthase/aminodeoxychorismate synthase-like glutamine amidotransferase|nr:aminodeoxychorismate/anthranilate synthase component [Clostridia bacterium]
MILIIDNYDSFTYNLYQYIGMFNEDIKVFRNNKISIDQIEELNPSHIIISPGPKYPKDAGISIQTIKHFAGKIPILGVCLGHQAIGEAYGSKVVKAKTILHGKQSNISVANKSVLFKGMSATITAGRYHSLIVEKESLADVLTVLAEDENGEIMALRHRDYPVFGVQFHPESILTKDGEMIIKNFLEVAV